MRITVWLATRDRPTWIAAAEVLVAAIVLLSGAGTAVRLLVGLPLVIHLGYSAMTAVPVGMIPGRPIGAKQPRRNQDLRSNVVGFLNEVRRVEDFAQRAKTGGLPDDEIQLNLQAAQRRILTSAAIVAKAMGRITSEEQETEKPARATTLLTHAPAVDAQWLRDLRA